MRNARSRRGATYQLRLVAIEVEGGLSCVHPSRHELVVPLLQRGIVLLGELYIAASCQDEVAVYVRVSDVLRDSIHIGQFKLGNLCGSFDAVLIGDAGTKIIDVGLQMTTYQVAGLVSVLPVRNAIEGLQTISSRRSGTQLSGF